MNDPYTRKLQVMLNSARYLLAICVNILVLVLILYGVSRVCILHQNVPTMLNQFLEIACSTGLNVENMINKAYGAYAYAMIDLNGRLDADQVAKIDCIPEVIRVRVV